ncbi:MAG: EAL domain-containing protein [Ketobacteraceae bacterium]|nr:EAL domain-containing protein [Ketobacteraceae bacterium]
MFKPPDFREVQCAQCAKGLDLGFDFSMAFQPIIDTSNQSVFAYEALVRGLGGESAGEVFKHVNRDNLYRFDQSCRVKAVKLASELNMGPLLSINFMPNAIYRPELCIRATLEACSAYGFPVDRLIFEITESEEVRERDHLKGIVDHYKQRGFYTAIDDFGAGYSGLNLVADIQTDLLKIDMALVRNIHQDEVRQCLVKAVVQFCRDLDIRIIAEGIETREEFQALDTLGIHLMQGFYFARPAFETLPEVDWSLAS